MNEGIIAAVTAIATAITTMIGKVWFDKRRSAPKDPNPFWQYEIGQLRKEMEELRKDFLDVTEKYSYLKAENKGLKRRITELEKHNAVLEATNENLKKDK